MSTLLVHMYGSRLYNKVIFRPHLYVYDDRIVYKKRHWLTHDEIAITYNHISQINLYKYIVRFAHMEIVTTAPQTITIRWVMKRDALRAKKIIDEKVYQAQRKRSDMPDFHKIEVGDFEMALKRLEELLNTGRISMREFKHKRKELLKRHY